MKRFLQAGPEAKRGVALIVVLGFLSLMIMMAVTFLTQARTERLVASSTMEAQRGRQLVRTALTAAMNDYSIELWGQQYLLPPSALQVFASIAPTAPTASGRRLVQDRVRLMAGEAQRWLPRRYVKPPNDASNTVADAEWILVREDPTDSRSRILGRYAYACFDMSGGIDANLVALNDGASSDGIKTNWPGHPIARASVRDVGLGELAETANAGEFKRLRRGWHGFDNLAELIMLTNGKYNGGEQNYEDEDDESVMWGPPAPGDRRWRDPDRIEGLPPVSGPALTSSKVTDLTPYSLSAYRGVYNFASAIWQPPVLCNAGAAWATVLTPVNAQLVTPADTVKAIADYFDADSTPQGDPNYPSVEAVPMFNEIRTRLRVRYVADVGPTPGPGHMYLDLDVDYEVWYPFPSEDNEPAGNFTIKTPTIGGGYDQAAANQDVFIRCAVLGPTPDTATVLSSPLVSPSDVSFVPELNGGRPKAAGTMHYEFEVLSASVGPTARLAVQRILTTPGKSIAMQLGGTKVDQMEYQANVSWTMADGDTQTVSYEVDDPRLNHLKARWTLANAPNLGQVNGSATAAGYGAPGGEGLYLYCRNGLMATPAELGFIPTGKPWETIDLCTEEGAEMLAGLVTDTNVYNAVLSSSNNYTFYTNGTINPSTSSTNVLLAAFTKLMKREVPNVPDMPGPDDGELDSATALALANSMIFESRTKKIQATGGAFMSGSAWARVPAMRKGGALAGLGLNKNQRESLIRNTWGLFSPNNSMFTVLVIGQAIKEGPGQAGALNLANGEDMITGERRGVALVWRDPFPSTGGYHHEMFVRMFKFLDE